MQEDIFILIESYRREFTEVEEIIANYFLGKKKPLTNDKLAKSLAVSKASITRFCKKIGLNNYKELVFLYNLSLNKDQIEPSIASAVTSVYHSLATRSDSTYSKKDIDVFCSAIRAYRIIHFWGKGFNSYAAMDFQFKFSRVGKYVRIVSDEKSIALSARFIEEDELIIVASLRGQDEQLLEAMRQAKAKGLTLLLITSNQHSPLVTWADVTLFAAGFTREESLGNISPQIPILIQLDMVYERYIHLYADSVRKWVESETILRKEGE